MVVHVYSMPQVAHVTLDNFSSGDHMITSQHATNPLIRLFRNTDQRLDILAKTIDRRPLLFSATEEVHFKVFDKHNQTVIDVVAELEDFEKGHLFVIINRTQTGALQLGNYSWCMLVMDTLDGSSRLLFTDQNYGPNAPLKVLEGPLPPQEEALAIDPAALINNTTTSTLVGAAQTTNISGVHSVVLGLTNYTGSMTVQATLDVGIPEADSEWTEVSVTEFEDVSEARHVGFIGNYNWVRLIFSTAMGLDSISYRNL